MNESLRVMALALLTSAVCLHTPSGARAAQPELHLEPAQVAPGEPATLVVTTDSQDSPTLPRIAGVQITPVGQRSQIVQTNGRIERSTSYLYAVSADEPGERVIRGITVDGQALAPVTLHVRNGARSSAPSAASAPVAARPEDAAQRAFLQLRVDRRELYAGESVPFTARAYILAGTSATLTGAPSISSDAFVVSGLDDKPKQSETTLDGERYLVVTWRGSLMAAKPGEHALEMTLPLSLEYREAGPAARPQPGSSLRDLLAGGGPFGGGSPFGAGSPFDAMMNDPFFASMLDRSMLDSSFSDVFATGRMVQRDVKLRANAAKASIRALPSEGRPADFSGAVGSFELDAELPTRELKQGEPVDLRVTLKGQGNFGHFEPKGLSDSKSFRAYAPHSELRAADGAGLRGTLTVTQPVVAKEAGNLELPGLTFSYFDPKRGEYVTKQAPALPVRVAPGASAPAASTDTPVATKARPDEVRVRSLQGGGVPDWLWPSTIAALALGLLAAAVIVASRSSRVARLGEQLRRRRQQRRQRVAMQRAAEQGDFATFVRLAHDTLQQRLSSAWQMRPESVTAAELSSRWPGAPALLPRLFELADQARYGAGREASAAAQQAELMAWARQLHDVLDHMEVRT